MKYHNDFWGQVDLALWYFLAKSMLRPFGGCVRFIGRLILPGVEPSSPFEHLDFFFTGQQQGDVVLVVPVVHPSVAEGPS